MDQHLFTAPMVTNPGGIVVAGPYHKDHPRPRQYLHMLDVVAGWYHFWLPTGAHVVVDDDGALAAFVPVKETDCIMPLDFQRDIEQHQGRGWEILMHLTRLNKPARVHHLTPVLVDDDQFIAMYRDLVVQQRHLPKLLTEKESKALQQRVEQQGRNITSLQHDLSLRTVQLEQANMMVENLQSRILELQDQLAVRQESQQQAAKIDASLPKNVEAKDAWI